jgi:mono/diheme cytochrome c family protein
MKRALILSALALTAAVSLSGCKFLNKDEAAGNAAAGPPAGAPPPLPPYQMRAEVADADRLKPASEGAALFSHRCGACHLTFGMGTNLITARQAAAGQKPVPLLADRTDLTADYVKAVARNGKGAMPRQTKVDVTDAELDKIAAYLGKGK